MAGLGERHYQAVLDLIGEAHDAQTMDDLRTRMLPALVDLVPADWASYNETDADGKGIASRAEPEIPDWAHEAWGRLAGENPLAERFARTRDGRAYRFSDVVSREELERLAIWRELYAPLGVEYQMAFTLPSPPAHTVAIALSRRTRDFDDAERAMVDLARPHLIQAYRNVDRIRRGPDGPAPEALRRLGLSGREAAVLAAFARGQSTEEAAAALGVSARTVHKHAQHIHAKLGVGTRAQAVAAAWAAPPRRSSTGCVCTRNPRLPRRAGLWLHRSHGLGSAQATTSASISSRSPSVAKR